MRVLILGVSTLALGACSMGGGGWGYGHSGQHQTTSGHYGSDCGVAVNPCGSVHTYQPAAVYQPAPVKPAPCQAHPCSAGSYAVSPYAPAAAHAQTPDAHAYGSHAPHYGGHHGLRGTQPVQDAGFYGTLGVTMYDVEDDVFGVQGRLGYNVNEYFGAELEASTGFTRASDSVTTLDALGNPIVTEIKTGVDHQIAAFGTLRYPLTQNVKVLGRVGYHDTKFNAEELLNDVTVTEGSTSLDGVAFGAGVEYDITARDAFRLDYTNYDTDAGSLNSVSLAYLRRF